MLEVGRIVMKIAGRDAGKVGAVIDVLDDNYVLLDGEVRRRKCNINHLEPLEKTIEVKKNATHADVLKALGIKEEKKKTAKKKEKAVRPRAVRMKKVYTEPKKESKKAEVKTKTKSKKAVKVKK